jgi:hypothetical protein
MIMKTHALLAVVVLACATHANAQERRDPLRIWVAGGLGGGGGANDVTGMGLLMQLAVQKRPHYAALRGFAASDISGFPDDGGGDSFGEMGLMYGRVVTAGYGHASLSSGLSVVGFDYCPNDYPNTCTTVGIPIVAEAALSAKVAGLGIQVFGNINPRVPYLGMFIFFALGWLP